MQIFCDFDGTITTEDVTNFLWDRHGTPGWRDILLPPYRRGETTNVDVMDAGWRVITISKNELLAEARASISLRPGFLALLDACEREHWSFHVISGGIDWYVDAFLPPGVSFTACVAALEDGWRVRLPAAFQVPPGVDFKVHVFRQRRTKAPDVRSVFVGDGRNDFQVAAECDLVCAVKGSTLARLCHEAGIQTVQFESFDELVPHLLRAQSLERERIVTPGA
jgi:HAD superfamily phosphoserine phosphatase-like hydrolase